MLGCLTAKPVAVSTDGTCGEQSVAAGEYKSCVGSGFGDCCSAGGWYVYVSSPFHLT